MTKSTIWRRLGLFAATSSLVFASGSALTAAPEDNPNLRKHFTTKAEFMADRARTVKVGAESYGPFSPTVINVDLRTLASPKAWQPGDPIKHIPRRANRDPDIQYTPAAPKRDPLLDKQLEAERGPGSIVTGLNFAGQGFSGVQPPDTVGDVGINYYIQAVNAPATTYTIYNKSNGSVAAGPFTMVGLGSGSCASSGGDPIVLFDEAAGQWLLSEFSASTNTLCVYISQTGDPIAGGWFAYQFNTPNFPDYPKYGVWGDAYYVSANENSPSAYALERSQMLSGAAATMQRFTAPSLTGFGFQALTPADIDGATPPPAGAPGIFMRHRDTEVHGPFGLPTADQLELWEFDVDFATPASSTFSLAQTISIAEIDSDLCGLFSFSCFDQPGGSADLDPLREVIMHRLAYRVIGGTQKLVGNLVTDVTGSDQGGIRWFELSNSGTGWSLTQEGTYAPDTDNRFMGSIAMDQDGNIGLGYSVSSTATSPSIAYTGRTVGAPLGTLPEGEFTVVTGVGANGSNRWGDYSSMSVDPVDGCTFWYTNEYASSGIWNTQIASFSFINCGTPAVCGDSELGAGEACDDGNAADGDGCSSSCQIEAGYECTLPIPGGVGGNALADGGFEAGTPNPSWAETSINFGTPLCDATTCGVGGGTGPNTGDWWAWFGGIAALESGSVSQSVVIPPAGTQLVYELEIPVCGDGTGDFMDVKIDGNLVDSYDNTDPACNQVGYVTKSIDLTTAPGGPYNDGAAHTVLFESSICQTGCTIGTNFFVDDVFIDDGAGGDPVPSMCTLLPQVCEDVEDFESGLTGWTLFNTGALPLDWGTTDDGICWSVNLGGAPAPNVTGGGGEAACIDSDQAGNGEVEAYLCSPALDFSTYAGTDLSFLYNYQIFGAAGPDDIFVVLVGTAAPSPGSIGSYTTVFSTGGTNQGAFNALPGAEALIDVSAFDGESNVHVCYGYGANFDWYAQVDDIQVIADDCNTAVDTDGDGVTDDVDNCVFTPNAAPLDCDTDGDGIGNRCDANLDFSPDGFVGFGDLGAFKTAFVDQVGGTYTPEADLDCSGSVGFDDLNIFRLRFNTSEGDPDNIP